MPKRRKYKDNPYTLEYINNKCYIKFKDSKDILQVVEVSKDIHNIFDKSELIDISLMNEYSKHIEHLELSDEILYSRSIDKKYNIEQEVEQKILYENLYNAINSLTDTQKKRIKLYYFEYKTMKEIAEIENCTIGSVKDSIDSAIKKLKKLLK